jgi:hypothetical protein
MKLMFRISKRTKLQCLGLREKIFNLLISMFMFPTCEGKIYIYSAQYFEKLKRMLKM